MSEATLQADLARELETLTSLFGTADVVVNDWSILDGPRENAPYILIQNAESFHVEAVQTGWSITWEIPFLLIESFSDWTATWNNLRDHRQAVIDKLKNVDGYNASSSRLAWGLRDIRNEDGIKDMYDRYVQEESEAIPVYQYQKIVLVVEEISLT